MSPHHSLRGAGISKEKFTKEVSLFSTLSYDGQRYQTFSFASLKNFFRSHQYVVISPLLIIIIIIIIITIIIIIIIVVIIVIIIIAITVIIIFFINKSAYQELYR